RYNNMRMNSPETVTIEAFQALQAQLAALQAEVQELRAENARLRDENQRLREELKALKQAPFKPRRRRKSQRKDPTKRQQQGRKAGHAGSGRSRPTRIDRTEYIAVGDQCPDCGEHLTGEGLKRERVIEDIEPVRPTQVTCYEIERRWCPCCRTYKEAPVADALPRHRLGLNVMLFVVYQKVALGLSYGKIRQELATYFGLQVSKGQLSNIVAEVADFFGPAYARLIEVLRQQAAVHVDETGWRVNGDNHWLWVFISDVVTLYILSHSRGSLVPKALLGSEFDGSVISDFYSAYSPLEYTKGKCWAHLLRDAHQLIEGKPPPDPERLEFKEDLHHLFLEMGLALEQVALDEAAREALYQEMRERLQAFAQRSWSEADCCRLARRIKKHLDDLLLWLRDPAVEATNNAAERALRPAVITRKTSFGSHSKKGALDFARLLSLIRTWEQQGHDFFSTAHGLLSQPCS
ncbi:MAG: IS66 family transposase, partial [Anaerolineae bacterium]